MYVYRARAMAVISFVALNFSLGIFLYLPADAPTLLAVLPVAILVVALVFFIASVAAWHTLLDSPTE